jgi:uncharacterized protein (TIGR02246 family)
MNSDEKAIRELVDQWMSATKAGDTAAVLDLMTEDVMFLVAGRAPFGKSQFAASLRSMAEQEIAVDGNSELLDVRVADDWAFAVSKLRVTTSRAGAQQEVRTGHTLTVFHKQGGKWRLARDANLLTPGDTK